jgi:hypothetical protein
MAQDAGAGRVGRAQSGQWDVEPTQVVNSAVTGTLRGYVRRVDLFKEHAGAAFL